MSQGHNVQCRYDRCARQLASEPAVQEQDYAGGLQSYVLYSHGLYSYDLYSYGLYNYGLYSYDLYSYWLRPI